MSHAAFRPIRLLLLAAIVSLSVRSPQTVIAQLSGTPAEKPIAIGYMRTVTPGRMIDYVLNFMERLEIGEATRAMMSQEEFRAQLEGMQPAVDEPMYGVAWYMVTGLIPSFESISFQPVVDEADARRLMNANKANYGENGFVEDLGNGCFRSGYRYSNSNEMPDGFDESSVKTTDIGPTRGWKSEQKIVLKDGTKYLENTQSYTEYSRFHDHMLFKADFEELLEMELPSADSVMSSVRNSNDLGFDAYLDRIPIGIRQLGWNMLTAAVGAQLQQYDGETDTSYNMRRSSGDLGLMLVKAVLFDIDNSTGWMRFASADDDSIRGELRIRARNNSALSGQLTAAEGLSQFAPILNDNAAATMHLCVRFPKEAPAALLAAAAWMQDAIDQETRSNPAMIDAAQVVAASIAGIAEHRNLELLLKAGWSDSSGGVFYGGLQVDENPQLLRSLHHFMTQSEGAPPNVDEMIALSEVYGHPSIRFALPDELVANIASTSGLRISHVYLLHEGSRLWFAAGAENANEILRQSIDRCHEGGLAYRTPLFTAKIDMERWLAYPQEDPSGIAALPLWLDANSWWFPPQPMAMFFGLGNDVAGKPTPIMQRVFELGGSQQAGLTVAADESGILVHASIGEALANHMLARMIESQESMMKRVQGQLETLEEAVEAAETVAEPVPVE